MTERGSILVMNAGSSSIKFASYDTALNRHLKGEMEGIGTAPRLRFETANGGQSEEDWSETGASDVPSLTRRLVGWIEARPSAGRLAAIGHRVATGGLDHSAPVRVTDAVLDRLRGLEPLAPLHLPRNLAPMAALGASHPHVPQVACFDTAFHSTLPPEARHYALPRALSEAGAQRYGFHGLSYEYIASRLPALDDQAAKGRTIVCHLGSGASLCALRGGVSVATTMGFSPLSGLVMATRPGDLDPGLMIWLLRERGMSVDEVERMLYHDAGLKGVSGLSGDMRVLLASEDARAAEAVGLFVHSVVTEIGRLTAALGGLDALIFTAGIGEHSPAVRDAVCGRLGWLGLRIDAAANAANACLIGAEGSSVAVMVVPTDEEMMVARHTAQLVLGRPEKRESTA